MIVAAGEDVGRHWIDVAHGGVVSRVEVSHRSNCAIVTMTTAGHEIGREWCATVERAAANAARMCCALCKDATLRGML